MEDTQCGGVMVPWSSGAGLRECREVGLFVAVFDDDGGVDAEAEVSCRSRAGWRGEPGTTTAPLGMISGVSAVALKTVLLGRS